MASARTKIPTTNPWEKQLREKRKVDGRRDADVVGNQELLAEVSVNFGSRGIPERKKCWVRSAQGGNRVEGKDGKMAEKQNWFRKSCNFIVKKGEETGCVIGRRWSAPL